MPDLIRWAILGAGRIARKFAADLAAVPGARLVAVGSRSGERARALAGKFGAPRAYDSYAGLAADPEADVVYVATRNHAHREACELALATGKGVLCEKPFALDAMEAAAVIGRARARRCFLMEAMWTRFIPAVRQWRQLIDSGRLGEARLLQVDFGFRAEPDPRSRLFDPTLGGGALLDVGVYAVSLASWLFGPPTRIESTACIGETGVDESVGILLDHPGGRLSLLSASIRLDTAKTAVVYGAEGAAWLSCPWWKARAARLEPRTGHPVQIDHPFPGNGYQFEIQEVHRCLAQGQTESPVMPLAESLEIMKTLDAVRRRWSS